MAETLTIEGKNITTLAEARKNLRQNSEPDEKTGGGSGDAEKYLDFMEFLMVESAAAVFWIGLGGWIPIWGGIIDVILIVIIYVWYKIKGLKPPSLSPGKYAKLAGRAGGAALKTAEKAQPEVGAALKAAEAAEQIAENVPGGGDVLFLASIILGSGGMIPSSLLLIFYIYLANKR
jgi:hypothetical protein